MHVLAVGRVCSAENIKLIKSRNKDQRKAEGGHEGGDGDLPALVSSCISRTRLVYALSWVAREAPLWFMAVTVTL